MAVQGNDLSAVGRLLAEPARAAMLSALSGGVALPASDLARQAGIALSTASGHLTTLTEAGWIVVEQRGRHRYYRLAAQEIATLLEELMTFAPAAPVRTLRARHQTADLCLARSCYDHIAGKLGVALTDAMLARALLCVDGSDFALTADGTSWLEARGIDVAAAAARHRLFARRCLDWSERRDHLAGALGAAILTHWETQHWLIRPDTSRVLRLTPAGIDQLAEWGVPWPLSDEASLADSRS